MMSLEAIRASNRRATRRSQEDRQIPVLIEPEDVDAYQMGAHDAVSIPFIGYRVPRGYRKVGDPLFVDSSGFGREGEAAMTLSAFLAHVKSVGGSYWGSTEAGQFQIYVQRYDRQEPRS